MVSVYSPNSNFVVEANGCDSKDSLVSGRMQLGAINKTRMLKFANKEVLVISLIIQSVSCAYPVGVYGPDTAGTVGRSCDQETVVCAPANIVD